jgi:hypothetical protein
VRTHQLLTAFGWNHADRNVQQDASEFWLIFSDNLERQMKGTEADGAI